MKIKNKKFLKTPIDIKNFEKLKKLIKKEINILKKEIRRN